MKSTSNNYFHFYSVDSSHSAGCHDVGAMTREDAMSVFVETSHALLQNKIHNHNKNFVTLVSAPSNNLLK
jgi:hypothetical protein